MNQLLKDLIPIIIIQLVIQIAALTHLIYKKETRNLNVWIWAAIIIFGQILGSILYFTLGRSED